MRRFIDGEDRMQQALLPDCLEDYVNEENPVRVI
jgi:transposase